MSIQQTALVWYTHDLRVHDHPGLHAACAGHGQVIAAYVFDKKLFTSAQYGYPRMERYRARFLIETVADLQVQLAQLNIPLLVAYGDPAAQIGQWCKTHDVHSIYHQSAFTRDECATIDDVTGSLPAHVKVHAHVDHCLYHPEDVPMSIEELPEVFSSFRKIVEKKAEVRPAYPLPAPMKAQQTFQTSDLPSLQDLGYEDFELPRQAAFHEKGGETAAIARLNYYFFESKKLSYYKKTRNGLIGADFSAKASPWLANGSLSPRTMYWMVKDYEEAHGSNNSTYWMVFELIWRDYFKYLAMKHGDRLFYLSGMKRVHYSWSQDADRIAEWIDGRTASPFVNANMIELKRTGWMSNRGRQNAASYLAKTMQVDWRIGAAYFESMLIDYDVHSNYGNWQYVAGVGNDPRDRTFNVQLQAKRYDPHGTYQRMWLQQDLFNGIA